MLKELFDKIVIDVKNVISIYDYTSQLYTTKNPDKHSKSKSEDRKWSPKLSESPQIFANNWEDLPSNTL